MPEKPTRVLQILHNLKSGGVQADTLYPERLLSRESLSCDVLLLSDTPGELEEEFKQYGRIFRIPLIRRKNKVGRAFHIWFDSIIVYRQTLNLLHEEGPYDAVHARHMMFIAPCLFAAKKAGVPIRIGHSHVNAPERERLYIRIYLAICRMFISKSATLCVGVTQGSNTYLFGEEIQSKVIRTPALDLNKYNPKVYQQKKHEGLRLIQVGSYGERKNQLFTIDVLNEIMQKGTDAHLVFIGYTAFGSSIVDKMKAKIYEYGLENKVTFLPSGSNVAEAYAASDIMILPSIQEGLPNTALEAQAMGLPCFLSTSITTETDCGLCQFLPLDNGSSYWADEIIKYSNSSGFEKRYIDMSAYDSKKVCRQYLSLWRGASWDESMNVYQ